MGQKNRSPWAWIPTLYFAEGMPYVVVMTVSVIMYKRLGISNTDIALYTSWLYLPWVIKPFWSPVVDLLRTKRWWILIMQLFVGAGMAGIALTIPAPAFFQYTLAFFWLVAFSSATHDIAADGFYMLGLDEHQQAFFVGIRSTFYRLAMITGQGLLIIFAGTLESKTGLEPLRFDVHSDPAIEVPAWQRDTSVYEAETGELRFLTNAEEIRVPAKPISAVESTALLVWAKSQNQKNGHIPIEEAKTAKIPSWWQEHVSTPLKQKLKSLWGKEDRSVNQGQFAGNIALIGIRLSAPPEEGRRVVLNLDRKKGDKSFRLAHGERLTFTQDNWNRNAWVIVQIDPKLDRASVASFVGLSGNIPLAWSITFYLLAGMFMLFFLYHRFALPRPVADKPASEGRNMLQEFLFTFVSYFKKENAGVAIAFFLLYRLGESQLVKLAAPFLLDAKDRNGLGLTTGEVGVIYGTIGILFLTFGGILGGWVASKKGLKYWLWWMTIAINLPNAVYVFFAWALPESFVTIAAGVAVEQFGYGFGFTAYMLYMIYFSEGKSKTAHFAISTGFMALGMMLPGMLSGWLQEIIGYFNFFVWVMICTIPGFLIVKFIKVDPTFGIKKSDEK